MTHLSQSQPPVVIVGGGFAGLVAACEFKRRGVPFCVFEAGSKVGGLATSFHDDEGFSYDFGAHFITNRLAAALGVSAHCRVVRRYGESVWLRGRSHSFPFGVMCRPRYVASALSARAKNLFHRRQPANASEWYEQKCGASLAQEVAVPLLQAWSGRAATELSPAVSEKTDEGVLELAMLKSASWLTRRAVAIGYGNEKPQSPNVWHVYPEGGLSTLIEHLLEEVRSNVFLESPVEAILVEDDQAVGVRVHGQSYAASAVMSTAPVHILSRLIEGSDALEDLADFRYRPMVFANLRLDGRCVLPDVVLWTPEDKYPFLRVTEAPLSMPWLAPEGKTILTVDIGCEVGDDFWSMEDDRLSEFCLDHLQPIIPDIRQRYLGSRVLRTPFAYPVFDNRYEEQRLAFKETTGIQGLHSIGRSGEFGHLLLEDIYWRTLAKTREVRAATLPAAAFV